MARVMRRAPRAAAVLAATLGALLGMPPRPAAACRAQSARPTPPRRVAVEPGLEVVATPEANLVVLLRHDTAVVVGPQLPALTAAARALLAERGARHVAFVVATPGGNAAADAAAYGDGGWTRTGAVVLAHERFRARLAQRAESGGWGPTTTLPAVGFSEVVQLRAGGSDVHVIRQRPGATGGDAVVHFEDAAAVYLGGVFTADGYPALDPGQGGSIDSMITTVAFFRRFPAAVHMIPGRGPVATVSTLGTYGDMLVAVRDRVRRLAAAGRSSAAVVAARPAAEFDGAWGHGPVSADQFVAAVYESVAARK